MTIKKVGIIGIGNVGRHVMLDLVNQGIPDEIVLVDLKDEKSRCEATDINAGMAYMPNRVKVYAGTYEDLADASLIVTSFGKIELTSVDNDRNGEMPFTIDAARKVGAKLKACGFHGVLIDITNPCDVISHKLAEILGLPRGRVFGTGTGLDTARLLYRLSADSGVDQRSITAYMLGEHGVAVFAPLSVVSFHGVPLAELAKDNPKLRYSQKAISKAIFDDAWAVCDVKHCTEHGIAATAARMAKVVLNDEKTIMPASAPLDGEYGERNVFAGVPCLLGKDGIERILELPLTPDEKAVFHDCCESIRQNIAKAETFGEYKA